MGDARAGQRRSVDQRVTDYVTEALQGYVDDPVSRGQTNWHEGTAVVGLRSTLLIFCRTWQAFLNNFIR